MENKKIKLVIWDLDNTIWQGILSEGTKITLTKGIKKIIETLDSRGILQSIASKNYFDDAYEKLKEFGIDKYFLDPQINWNSKSENISKVVKKINISVDTVAFIDDQIFELDEVKLALPTVTTINATELKDLLDKDCMNPTYITEDSKLRRLMYQNNFKRQETQSDYKGTQTEFLHTLNMKMNIAAANEDDLKRAEELTVRTHQLNSTGYTYSYGELKEFICNDHNKLWVADLEDIYGQHGKIGLILINCEENEWTLKLLLTSCRVMSYGIGSILLSLVINKAIQSGKKLYAEFVPTDRNRIMSVTYSMMGFKKYKQAQDVQILEYKGGGSDIPQYIEIKDETN